MKVDGHCHCGEITFEAEVDPDAVNICHCTDCQTLSGTAFASSVSDGPDSGPRVAVYEYALAVAGSATPRRPVLMNSTITAAAIHKRPASMKASK